MKSQWTIAALVALVCLTLGMWIGQPAGAQSTSAPGNRFQMVVIKNESNDNLYLLDTTSGETWWRDHVSVTKWKPMGSPVIGKGP